MKAERSDHPKRKVLRSVIPILIIIVICVLGLGMVYVWYFLQDSSSGPVHETQVASELSFSEGYFSEYARLPTAQSDLVLSPDERYLAYSYNEKDILIWDVRTRQELKTLQGHDESIASIRFSPDAKFLASSSRGQVILWDLAAGTIVHQLKVDVSCGITFLDGGDSLAVDCPDTKEMIYVDTYTGLQIADQTGVFPKASNIEFSPRWDLLLRFDPSSPYLNIYNRGFYKPIATFSVDPPSELICAKFLSDGIKVIGAFSDGNVSIWDTNSGELIWDKQYDNESLIQQIFISPSESKPYTMFLKKDGTADLLDITSGDIRTFNQSFYTTAVFSPDNQFFALGNSYTMVELWEFNSSTPAQYLTGGQHAPPKIIIFSSSGNFLIVVPFEGETKIYQKK